MRKKSGKRPLLVYFLTYSLVFLLVAIILHEAAHILVALGIGVAPGEIGFGFYHLSPTVWISKPLPERELLLLYYSGGMASGTVMLALYLFWCMRRYRCSPTPHNWARGLACVAMSIGQLVNGIVEGAFHQFYEMSVALPYTEHALKAEFLLCLAFLGALFIHFLVCPAKAGLWQNNALGKP